MRSDANPGGPGRAPRPEGAAPRRASRPFVVPVAGLRKVAGTSRHETRCGVIDGLAAVGVAVPEGEPICADVEVSSYPGGIDVAGTVTASWGGECRRCGGPVAGEVVAAVRERYAPAGSAGADDDTYLLAGDELDLEPLARDAVLLDLPLAPLCSDQCLGLCPQCGTNWNEGPCHCPGVVDPRWSALDALRES